MKKLTLAACLLILASYQQTQARSIPTALGGAALASYFGYGTYHCFTVMTKSDEELIDLMEQEYLSRLQEDPTYVIAVQPKEMLPFARKLIRATFLCCAALTGLGGYLIKKGLAV